MCQVSRTVGLFAFFLFFWPILAFLRSLFSKRWFFFFVGVYLGQEVFLACEVRRDLKDVRPLLTASFLARPSALRHLTILQAILLTFMEGATKVFCLSVFHSLLLLVLDGRDGM